jgi:hypothetical protein
VLGTGGGGAMVSFLQDENIFIANSNKHKMKLCSFFIVFKFIIE